MFQLKRTTEDYLKTIYLLHHKYNGARGVEIAQELHVSRSTACIIIKRLLKEGYVTRNEAHEIFLTEEGKQIAENTLKRNQMFRQLLIGLGVDEKIAAADACEMEHVVSMESFEALKMLTARKDGGEIL